MADKIQVIICKCGSEFSACIEPECYIDEDYIKELKMYLEQGCTVEMRNKGEWQYERCKCEKEPKEIINPNQLKIF